MKKWLLVLSSVAMTGFNACKAIDNPPIEHLNDVNAQMSLSLDPALTYDEKALLIGDLYKAMQFEIEAGPKSYFSKSFGGPKSDSVIRYIDERIKYIVPASADLDSRKSYIETSGTGSLLDYLSPQKMNDFELYTMATNIGTVLWFEALGVLPRKLAYKIGDTNVPVDSSRVGIIRMGKGYTAKENGSYIFPDLNRIATLVHEARHSDCTGGISDADLEALLQGELPQNRSCGHLHVRCPAGHDYEGAYACDGDAWGAYSIEAVYSAALAKVCKNCTESDKEIATVIASDSLSRVIPLNDMVQGKLGNPDMSSSTLVHD